VGGRGGSGSADSLRVGVTLGYPSGPADPLDSDGASVTDVLTTADTTAISTTSRQPPTVADTTAAAFQSPTLNMTSYYTRAKARSDLEGEEMEQRDVAPIATTSTSSSILLVGLHDAFTGESESVSVETVGPATTHPELHPAGDHPSVGGRGVFGSADSPLVGVTTLGYPSEHADPLDSALSGLASSAEVMTAADTTTATASPTRTAEFTSRQPPTVAEVTAAASRSPTHA